MTRWPWALERSTQERRARHHACRPRAQRLELRNVRASWQAIKLRIRSPPKRDPP